MAATTRAHCVSNVLSRRSFIRLTMGSLTLLPSMVGSMLVAPDVANAEEGVAQPVDDAEVYVVCPSEVGLVVRDVSKPESSGNAIKGAHVRLISRFNKQSVEGTTNDKGAVLFDISALSEDAGKAATPASYAFNGTIEVDAPGYRRFRTGLYRVQGGVAISVPTQPLEQGVPYPMSVSFDEWDVLYTTNEFVASTANSADHVADVVLMGCPGGAVQAALLADGQQVASATATVESDGSARLAFTGVYLLQGGSAALPVGDGHSFRLQYAMGSTTYEVPVKLTVSEAPPEAQDPQLKKDLNLFPFDDSSVFTGFTLPSDIPVIGGLKISIWKPEFPIDFAFDPFGYIRVSATTPPWGYVRDNGQADKNAWSTHPRKSAKEQFDKYAEDLDKKLSNVAYAYSASHGHVRRVELCTKFSFTVSLELLAAATWDVKPIEKGEQESRGKAALQVRFGANYTISDNLLVGPIPVFIQFAVGLNGAAGGGVAFVSPSVWELSKYRWDYSSLGFTFQLGFNPALSVGVGVAGLASIGVKGKFSLTFFLVAGPHPQGYEDKPTPRIRLAMSAGLTLEIQFICFSKSVKIYDFLDKPDLYDNWSTKSLEECLAGYEATVLPSFAEVFSDAKIVTARSLEAIAEFKTQGMAAMDVESSVLCVFELRNADGASVGWAYLPEEAADSAVVTEEPSLPLDDEDVTLVPTNETTTQWSLSLPELEPVGDHDYRPAPVDLDPNVVGLGVAGGIRPSVDQRLAKDVMSDSRTQLVRIDGMDYLMRIASVLVNGKARTRVVAEQLGGSDRRVIDFDNERMAGGHDNYFDYDFDAKVCREGPVDNYVELLQLFVISGRRDRDDGTTAAEAAGSTVFSYVCITNWSDHPQALSGSVSPGEVDATGADEGQFPFRSYSCPQVSIQQNVDQGRHTYFAVVAYLERASASESDLFGDDPDRTKVGVGLFFAWCLRESSSDAYALTMRVAGMDKLREVVTGIGDASVTEMTAITDYMYRESFHIHILRLKGSKEAHYLQLGDDIRPDCIGIYAAQDIDWELSGEQTNLVPVPKTDHLAYARLDDKPNLEGWYVIRFYYALYDGKLTCVQYYESHLFDPEVKLISLGSNEVNVRDFGVAREGGLIFWPATREKSPSYLFDGSGEPVEGNGEQVYQILASRIRDDKASRPFVFAEVDHPLNQIKTVGDDAKGLSFVSSPVVDLEAGRGELWYTTVPYVRCATIVYADPVVDVVARGDKLPFFVTLRNDGNTFLSGVDIEAFEKGGAAVGAMSLDFSESSTLESEWNPRGEDGKLQNVEDDWALAPGATSRYCVGSVTIPDTWEGKKELELKVTALREAPSNELEAMADTHVIDYLHDEHADSLVHIDDGLANIENGDMLSAADVTVVGSPVNPTPTPPDGWVRPTPGTDRTTPRTSQATRNPSQRTLPDTGEGVLGAASGLVALGGAALVAYGKRRADVEREEREKKSDR